MRIAHCCLDRLFHFSNYLMVFDKILRWKYTLRLSGECNYDSYQSLINFVLSLTVVPYRFILKLKSEIRAA